MHIYIIDTMANGFFDVFKRNSFRQVKLMLEAGYDVNDRNQRLETPLMACVKHCHDRACRNGVFNLLIESGADINLCNGRGQTVLMYSCILNQVDTVTTLLLMEDLQVNLNDDDGNTALMYACNLGFPNVVAILLDSHVHEQHVIDFSKENYDGYNVIDHAMDAGNLNIVKLLSKFIQIPESRLMEECVENVATALKTTAQAASSTPQVNESISRYIKDVKESAEGKLDQSTEEKETLILRTKLNGGATKDSNDFGLESEFQNSPQNNVIDIKDELETNEDATESLNQKESSETKLENGDDMQIPSPVLNLLTESRAIKDLSSGEINFSEHNDKSLEAEESTVPMKEGKSSRRIKDGLHVSNTLNEGICGSAADELMQNQHQKESSNDNDYVDSSEVIDKIADSNAVEDELTNKEDKTIIISSESFSVYGKPLPKIEKTLRKCRIKS